MLNLFLILLTIAGLGAVLFISLILLASIYAVYDIDRELTDDLTDE
jgi:hypothetical protein